VIGLLYSMCDFLVTRPLYCYLMLHNTSFSDWFEIVYPCFFTSNIVSKLSLIGFGKYSEQLLNVLHCYMFSSTVTICGIHLAEMFLTLKYASKWNVSAIVMYQQLRQYHELFIYHHFNYFADFWGICRDCYSHILAGFCCIFDGLCTSQTSLSPPTHSLILIRCINSLQFNKNPPLNRMNNFCAKQYISSNFAVAVNWFSNYFFFLQICIYGNELSSIS
jgi:hypothetical protein